MVSADDAYACRLQRELDGRGFKLYGVRHLAAARAILRQWQFDLVLCDADGIGAGAFDDMVRSLRREQRAPIVILSLPSHEDGLIAALEAGATELIVKAASARLIAVKLQRLLDLAARAAEPDPSAVALGDLRLDPRREQAVFRDRSLPLTGAEFELLLLLAARADGFVPP